MRFQRLAQRVAVERGGSVSFISLTARRCTKRRFTE
jgi:hypothetical protein